MTTRRSFFAAVAGVLAAAVLPARETTATPTRAAFERFNRPRDRFEPVRFEDIRTGDEIWVVGRNEIVYVSRGWSAADDVFESTLKIDPATNQWVDNLMPEGAGPV